MARTVSEFSTCSPSGDTVKNPCISLTISYSHCLGQRKRERLQSLETRLLDARPAGMNATYTSGGELQLQHPMQPPLLGPGNPATPTDSFYNLHPDFMIGASDTFCMCLTPCESACKTSEISSSYGSDQIGISTLLHYGMSW